MQTISPAVEVESDIEAIGRAAVEYMATIVCPNTRPQMSTVRPGVMQKIEPKKGATGEMVEYKPAIKASDIRTEIMDIVKSTKELVSLTDADIICSGGRGLGNADGFKLIKQFADKVGGVVGSSRAAVDNGWIDHSHQVGQTGTTVKPKIYFAWHLKYCRARLFWKRSIRTSYATLSIRL